MYRGKSCIPPGTCKKTGQENVKLVKFMVVLGRMWCVSRGKAHTKREVDEPLQIYTSQHLHPDGTICLYGL